MLSHFKKQGSVKAFSSSEIVKSRIGIGFEKLDRAVFDPEKAYDRVAELGVKWVRIQSGWQRTETEKGVYHFEWLDQVVDNLCRRKLIPWLCFCYGNQLYDEEAGRRFGGVGCAPIQNREQISAWHDYVVETVRRYQGKIDWFEIWNEPDCGFNPRFRDDPSAYGEFAKATAAAIREGNPGAKVIGGAFAGSNLEWVAECFDTGMARSCDAVSFHIYSANEQNDNERIRNLKNLMRIYNPELKLIQGEGGCQSRDDGCGALAKQAWTEAKQAKSLARHMISQLAEDVFFSSYFSCMDMVEALNGTVGDKASYMDFGYFGVLGADFNEEGVASGNYTPKPSYRALQVAASVFREEFSVEDLPIRFLWDSPAPRFGGLEPEGKMLAYYGFRKPNGSAALAYWKPAHLLSETFESSVSLVAAALPPATALVDMVDGTIYAPGEENIASSGRKNSIRYNHLPVYDRPMLLVFGAFL